MLAMPHELPRQFRFVSEWVRLNDIFLRLELGGVRNGIGIVISSMIAPSLQVRCLMNPAIPIQLVIVRDGAGTRLWPLSRSGFPKRFLSLMGSDSLFQQTIKSLLGEDLTNSPRMPYIVFDEEYIVILGITPDRPETRYGYIKTGATKEKLAVLGRFDAHYGRSQ